MTRDFATWVESVLPPAEPDPGGDVGVRPVGTMEFLREIFDERGPVSTAAVSAAWRERALALTRTGVELFRADLERTSGVRPVIDVWWSDELNTPVAEYYSNYTTPPLISIRAPEAICEVADNLRDHAVEDLWRGWPECPYDGRALHPQPVDGRAVWYCRTGDHVVAPIGELPAPRRDRRRRR